MEQLTIIQAMTDPKLFGRWFKPKRFRRDTWAAWRVFLKALFALVLEPRDLAIYGKHTGRPTVNDQPFTKAWLVCGRRSGKSLIAALVATYLAAFRDYSEILNPGETGVLMVIASDKKQARVVMSYVNAFFDNVPFLERMVATRLKESIELTNHIRIEIHTSDFRAVRGYTIIGAVCDEIAFWPFDEGSVSPDVEILNALEPGMATVPGALLLCLSSPYAQRGALFEAYQRNFGKDSDELVWQAATREMNPTVPEIFIDAAYEKDAAAAAAEYGARFRTDVEGFLTREVVEACVVRGCFELASRSAESYVAFCDPSGGSHDAMTLAIAHGGDDRAVLDLIREVKPPFSPEGVVAEFCETLRAYRVSTVVGDRYAGEWPREQFAKRGVEYRCSDKNRSELYLELLPAVNSRQVELLDHSRLLTQLTTLERRTARAGRDSVDHPTGGHDDVANAAAGALVLALAETSRGVLGLFELMKTGWNGMVTGWENTKREFREARNDFDRRAAEKEIERAKAAAVVQPGGCPNGHDPALVITVGGNMKHCNQCRAEWWPDAPPPVYVAGFIGGVAGIKRR